mgnify:CR=1 FL=1
MKTRLLAAFIATCLAVPAAHAAIIPVNEDADGVGLNDPTARAPEGGNPGTTVGEQRVLDLDVDGVRSQVGVPLGERPYAALDVVGGIPGQLEVRRVDGGDDIEAAARDIAAKYGVKVTGIATDITTETGRKEVLAACPNPDILVTNAAGPPAGNFRNFTLDDWRKAAESNLVMRAMPLRPAVRASQASAMVLPTGEIAPRPVTTTRRRDIRIPLAGRNGRGTYFFRLALT